MSTKPSVNVSDLINHAPISRFQVMVALLCFFVVALDGFDTAAIGFIAPAIGGQWGLAPPQLAPLFGAGLFGLMTGAFLFGPLSDRFGRKTILTVCVAVFGVMSLVSSWSPSLGVLIALRFLTGLGLGGAMPNAVTLTSEFCPENHRLLLVTTMFCGFTLGSAIGGLASAQIVADHGWRAVLVIGGLLPLALTPVLIFRMPESVRFLVAENRPRAAIVAALKPIAPGRDFDGAEFVLSHPKPAGLPVGRLFKRDLVVGTLLLWTTFFASLLIIYLLSSWLPLLMKSTGQTLKTASIVTSMFQVGGTVGAIALGWLMDRTNPHWVLAASYALAAVFIAAIGALVLSPWLIAVAVFGAGICVSGSQVGANALAASFYPTECRATGVSWANGVGRSGSVLGSMAGGIMMSMGLDLPTLFLIVAAPALVGGACMAALGLHRMPAGRARTERTPTAVTAASSEV